MGQSWVLVGMMGAGKTSIARHIAQATGRKHLDTDLMLQQRLGRPIPMLFQIYGEDAFRDHETSILKAITDDNAIVSTGGGIVIRSANWPELRRIGRVVYVKAQLEDLVARLETSKKKRPLLQVENWDTKLKDLLDQRTLYYEMADEIVDITGLNITEAAELVLERLSHP